MTSIQNQYWANQELKRHNAALEEVAKAELETKRSQAESAAKQAESASRQAGVKEREVAISETMIPFNKWESGSRTASNITKAAGEATSFLQKLNPVDRIIDRFARLGQGLGGAAKLVGLFV